MPEAVARDKFHCPTCGADAHWDPGKQALVCPYCGTVAPGRQDPASGSIAENDLAAALRDIPESGRGWKAEKISVKCQSCQAISVFDPQRVAQRCEFCGSAQLVPYEQTLAPVRPESLLAFKIAEGAVRENIRDWYGNRWFAPNKLKSRALTDTVKGVYIPYWTFDAQADAAWTAESGYYYYEQEQYRDQSGNIQSRRVQRVRWQLSAGTLQHFFDDELVSGTRGVDADLLRQVEPFPTKELVTYEPRYLAGWVVEQYQIDLRSAAQQSEQEMESQVRELCAHEVPGDTHRNLQVQTEFAQRTFKHVLFPIWLLTYTYGTRTYQVVVNGYTGEIAGKHPLSWVKIAFLILAIVAVAAGVAVISNR